MEHFFTPNPRIQDRHEFTCHERVRYTEGQLAVSIEEFMNHRWNWSDFRAFVTGDEGEMSKLLWIPEDTLIWVEDENARMTFEQSDVMEGYAFHHATLTAPSGETHFLCLAMDRQSSSLSAGASRLFWHAVKTSNCVKLRLQQNWSGQVIGLCSDPALSQVLEASPSLELLEFGNFDLEDFHCRALATLERTGLEVVFEECTFDAEGAKDSFIDLLRHSQVVIKLENCEMERSIIAALSGNTSVKSLSIDDRSIDEDDIDEEDEYIDDLIRSLAGALLGNQGIEHLSVSLSDGSDETWSLLLRSLWAHPRIQSVSLSFISMSINPWPMSALSKTSMMNAIGSMQYSGVCNRLARRCKRRGILSELHPPSTRDESRLF
jgi:hypothetical protein